VRGCRADLSRRNQGYLPGRGWLPPGPEAALKAGANGYAGVLIVVRQDGNHLQAGKRRRRLVTGSLPRAAAIGGQGLTVAGQGADPCC